jgi:hypothetical protein
MEVTSKPRKLKPENADTAIGFDRIVTERDVVTQTGEKAVMELTGFDMASLKKYQPYNPEVGLPSAEFRYSEDGKKRVCIKQGEPRYYLHGNELIRTWIGPNGKKRTLVRLFRPDKKKIDRQVMNRLIKENKLPQYG